MLGLQEGVLAEPEIESPHACREHPQYEHCDVGRRPQYLDEDLLRHDADARAGQSSYVCRPGISVNGSNLAEKIAFAHLAQDNFLADGYAKDDPDPAGHDEPDVVALIVYVNDEFVRVVVLPDARTGVTLRGGGIKVLE